MDPLWRTWKGLECCKTVSYSEVNAKSATMKKIQSFQIRSTGMASASLPRFAGTDPRHFYGMETAPETGKWQA